MDLIEMREESISFAESHLAECAAELLEWRGTAILRDGKVKELARLCSFWTGERDSLSVAESLVHMAALRAASQKSFSDSVELRGGASAPSSGRKDRP